VALGHLHVPQRVGGSDVVRYSGSPLPMGFGEAGQEKNVILVEFSEKTPNVSNIAVPRFQELKTLRGDWPELARTLDALKLQKSRVWLEVIYEGDEIAANLQERLMETVAGTGLEILRTRNNRIVEKALSSKEAEETLDDLDVTDVFVRCLDAHDIPEDQRAVLLDTYREVLTSLQEADPLAC
jgi:exonuclease SbcD